MSEIVRWRLHRNDCQNRGYVLDGYPKNYGQAEEIFVIKPPAPKLEKDEDGNDIPLDEEALAESQKPQFMANIYPESIISLNATAQFLRRRSKELQKQNIVTAFKWKMEKLVDKLD